MKRLARLLESTQRHAVVYKSKSGKWWTELAPHEGGEGFQSLVYGPFRSEKDAEGEFEYHSNPGGYMLDVSGTRSDPKASPNGDRVQRPSAMESVRVGTSQACVLHGHPKKAGSAADRPKGSEIKCYPFSGEGGRAGAVKKAFQMHTAIMKSQQRESGMQGMRRLQEVLSGSEALYGFCGWLTSRPEKTVMSASDDSGRVADLVGEFSKVQGLPAPRDGWDKELVSMNPVRRRRDAKGESGMTRLEADVQSTLEKGIHFRSKDWAEANEFSLSRRFPMVVMKGDDGEYWVVRVPDAERLAKVGYDYAR